MSQGSFNNRYHLESVIADKAICKKWGLKHECS